MKTEPEFPQIGKRMTYKVPEGFFDRITEETIWKARRREKSRIKIIFFTRITGVAALITGLVIAGFWTVNRMNQPDPTSAQIPAGLQADTSKLDKTKSIERAYMADQSGAQKSVSESSGKYSAEDESLDEVLASLTDDELLLLAAQSEADIFMEESDKKIE